MSKDYVEGRIKEALKQAGGNATKARQQIIAWTYEDSKLLHDLTKPHLTGIVAYNVERVMSGRSAPVEQPAPEKPKAEPVTGEDFGMEILKAVAAQGASVFGLEGGGAPQKRGQASKQHIDAIRMMASKSKTPKAPPKK